MPYTPISQRNKLTIKPQYIPVSDRTGGNKEFVSNVSGYSLSPDETDERWWEGAWGDDLREDLKAGNPVVASRNLPKGTEVKIGNTIYGVKDKMGPRYEGTNNLDILFPSKEEALKFGRKDINVELMGTDPKHKLAGETWADFLERKPALKIGGYQNEMKALADKEITRLESQILEAKTKIGEMPSGGGVLPGRLWFLKGYYKTPSEAKSQQAKAITNLEFALDAYRDFRDSIDRADMDPVVGNFVKDALKGIKDTLKEPDKLVPFSPNTIEEYRDVMIAVNKAQDGAELSTEEQSLIEKYRAKGLPTARGMGYIVGQMIAQMPTYISEFMLTKALVAKPVELGIKKAIGEGIEVAVPKILQKGWKLPEKMAVNDVIAKSIGIAAQSGAFSTLKVPQTMAENSLPYIKELKSPIIETFYNDLGQGSGFGKAFLQAFGSNAIEVLTEYVGGVVQNPVEFISKATLGKWLAKRGITDFSSKTFSELTKKVNWNGIIGEVFEEEMAELLQAPIEEREYKHPFTAEGLERVLTETLGIAAFGGLSKVAIGTVDRGIQPGLTIKDVSKEEGSVPRGKPTVKDYFQNPSTFPHDKANAVTERIDNSLEAFFREGVVDDMGNFKETKRGTALKKFVDELDNMQSSVPNAYEAARQNRILTELDALGEEYDNWTSVPDTLTVYRGQATGEKLKTINNYTLNRKIAEKFAGKDGVVGEYLVNKNNIEWINSGYLGYHESEAFIYSKNLSATTPIIQEARKYKSAEEFVKSQGTPIYHGTPYGESIIKEGFSNKNLGKTSGYEGVYGAGHTFTTDINRARLYGKDVIEAYIPKDVKLFKTNDPITDLFANPKIPDNSPRALSETLNKMGYDGIEVTGKTGNKEIVIFDAKNIQTKSQLTDIWNKAQEKKPITKPAFLGKELAQFKGFGDLTTLILEQLKGKTSVSRQFIEDALKQDRIKQAEKGLIADVLKEFKGDTIPAKEFADKVHAAILPLETANIEPQYERRSLQKEQRGNVAQYSEHLYQSPIKTSAGEVHFGAALYRRGEGKKPSESTPQNYFAHTRIEDMVNTKGAELIKTKLGAEIKPSLTGWQKYLKTHPEMVEGGTRRIIEIQSDLFQKGRLEIESEKAAIQELGWKKAAKLSEKELQDIKQKRTMELTRLEPYRNTWFERIIREEIKKAGQDNKTTLLFPTGETAMEIEGLGQSARFYNEEIHDTLFIEDLRVGLRLTSANENFGDEWIITDILGDGKFKAIPKEYADKGFGGITKTKTGYNVPPGYNPGVAETFDISGKVDTSNPIYKFYESEVQKYLKRIKPTTQRITDNKGVTWFKVDINKEDATNPVIAFKSSRGEKFTLPTEQAYKILGRFFDENEMAFTKSKWIGRDAKGNPYLGQYMDQLITILERNGKVVETVPYHEAFHAYINNFVSFEEKTKIIDSAKAEMARHPWLSKDYTSAEEWLADRFADYAKGERTLPGRILMFFQRMVAHLRRMMNKGGQAIKLFDDIMAKKRPEHVRTIRKTGAMYFMSSKDDIPDAMSPEEEARYKKDAEEWMEKQIRKDYIQDKIKGFSQDEIKEFSEIVKLKEKQFAEKDIDAMMKDPKYGQRVTKAIELLEQRMKQGETNVQYHYTYEELFEMMQKMPTPRDISQAKNSTEKSPQYQIIPYDLKQKIKTFYRPSRKLGTRMFQLMGNKDTTAPLLSKVFNDWAMGGVSSIVEPYASAFTIGTHSIKEAINSGLKEYHANLRDNEKYVLVKAIQDGKAMEAKNALKYAVKRLSDAIYKHSALYPEVRKQLDQFRAIYKEELIGGDKFKSYIRSTHKGPDVTVFEDEYHDWAQVFQKAFTELGNTKVTNITTAAIQAVIRKIGMRGETGQTLINDNGFQTFHEKIFGKYGTISAIDDIEKTFNLAKEKGTNIELHNQDGVEFLEGLKGVNWNTTGLYLDPPYVLSAERTYKTLQGADQTSYDKFTSGKKFYEAHKEFIDRAKNILLTNDVHAEYIQTLNDAIPDSKIYAYKEGVTPTSMITDKFTAQSVDSYLKEKPAQNAGSEMLTKFKTIISEKGLGFHTLSNIKKAFNIDKISTATQEQLDIIEEILTDMEEGDSFLTDLQVYSLKWFIEKGEFDKPPILITKRELIEKWGEKEDIMQGKLTKRLSDLIFAPVDIKEGHEIFTRIIDNAEVAIRHANRNIKLNGTLFEAFMRKAEKSRKGQGILKYKTHEAVFKKLSGEEVDLTPEELDLYKFLKNYWHNARLEMDLKSFRENYVTNIQAKLFERIRRTGSLVQALKEMKKDRQNDIPLETFLALDNIIGSEKFFRFALERKGGITPTFNLRRIFHEYSQIVENKKALDKILPEAQASQQLLLQKNAAVYMKRYLQNLKGRPLDNKFRTGKMKWVPKVLNRLTDVLYFQYLGFNWVSTLKNIVGGETNSFVYIADENENKLVKGFINDFVNVMRGKRRMFRNPKKAYKIIMESGILDGSYVDIARSDMPGRVANVVNKVGFIGMQGGEYLIRGSVALGQISKEEWLSGDVSDESFVKIVDTLAKTQGVYTKTQSPLFTQTITGRTMVQFMRWVFTNLALTRRVAIGARQEWKNGIKGGPNTRRAIRLFVISSMALVLGQMFAAAGWDLGKKLARAASELINTIISILTLQTFRDMLNNPTTQAMDALSYTIILQASQILGTAEPYPIEIKKQIWEQWISAIDQFGIRKKKPKPKSGSSGSSSWYNKEGTKSGTSSWYNKK